MLENMQESPYYKIFKKKRMRLNNLQKCNRTLLNWRMWHSWNVAHNEVHFAFALVWLGKNQRFGQCTTWYRLRLSTSRIQYYAFQQEKGFEASYFFKKTSYLSCLEAEVVKVKCTSLWINLFTAESVFWYSDFRGLVLSIVLIKVDMDLHEKGWKRESRADVKPYDCSACVILLKKY